MKYLVFDAGPLIALTMNGLLDVLEKFKKGFDGEFILTPAVKVEVVDKPIKIKKYKLEAVKVMDLIDRGVLKMSKSFIDDNILKKESLEVLKVANGVLRDHKKGEKITILQEGEASCLAFDNLVEGDCMIVVDERTTRFLVENPKKVEEIMEKKSHTDLDFTEDLLKDFKKYKIMRSAELLYIAHKKGLTGLPKTKDVLDALLYAVKFKGTSVSNNEIEQMKKMR